MQNCQIRKAIFFGFYNISRSNFAVSLFLICSFQLQLWILCFMFRFKFRQKLELSIVRRRKYARYGLCNVFKQYSKAEETQNIKQNAWWNEIKRLGGMKSTNRSVIHQINVDGLEEIYRSKNWPTG